MILQCQTMKPGDRYLKIVKWSDEDDCYVGTCPGLMLGGVHGDDEVRVYHTEKRRKRKVRR